MRTVDRILLFVAAVVISAAALGLWGYLAAWYAPGEILGVLDRAMRTGDLYIAAVFLTTLAVALLCFSLTSPGQPKGVVAETDLGQVRVGMEAVDSLVRKAALSIRGVREIKTDLSVDKLGLSVNLKLLVASDLSLPELTSQVQEAVSSYIQQTVGIAPKQVNVLVRNVAEPIRSRVN